MEKGGKEGGEEGGEEGAALVFWSMGNCRISLLNTAGPDSSFDN